jgi:lipopolysaccharide export LptBFGC system permease protein LptF
MLQNKIYQNYLIEILKTFLVILFGLTIIAWTVRAVNFLDLIVESGYSISTYFEYSFLNLFSILTKFIPLAFLIGLVIFIVRQTQENEFVILWTSGVKKLKLVNLFFIISIIVLFFYLIFSTFLTPYALNKSRSILNQQGYNSFLPTIRIQQFSDSFKGFTFLVEKKFKNEIKNVFIHDSSNTLKSLTVEDQGVSSTTIVAEEGIVEEKKNGII